MTLDFDLRLRAHALGDVARRRRDVRRRVELTPGIRSLQVQFDPVDAHPRVGGRRCSPTPRTSSPRSTTWSSPSRTVHLPLSWDDPSTREAIERYMRVVRDDAPWCPWNIEFIRRINGLDVDRRRAPTSCSTPSTSCSGSATCTSARRSRCRSTRGTGSSPRSTTRPARGRPRTRSASAARTCASTAWRAPAATSSSAGRCRCGARTGGRRAHERGGAVVAALLRPHPLVPGRRRRAARAAGRRRRRAASNPRIDDGRFSRAEHHAFVTGHAPDIAEFRAQRGGGVRRGARPLGGRRASSPAGTTLDARDGPSATTTSATLPDGAFVVEAPLHGCVARVTVDEGDRVAPGDTVVTLEAMKTESAVASPVAGHRAPGRGEPWRPRRRGHARSWC